MTSIDFNSAMRSAMDKTKNLLFNPLRLRMWVALGFASTLTAFGVNPGNFPSSLRQLNNDIFWQNISPIVSYIGAHLWIPAAAIMICFLLVWLAEVFTFIYTNMVVRESCEIRRPFESYKALGSSFMLWLIAFAVICVAALGIFTVLPIALANTTYKQIGAVKITLDIMGGVCGTAIVLISIVITVFAYDFIVTAMYAQRIQVMEAWSKITPIIKDNIRGLLLYILIVIAISIAISIASVIAIIAATIVMAIPTLILAIIGYLTLRQPNGGFASPGDLIYIAIVVPILLSLWYMIVCTLLQPAMVFRRAFSIAVLGQLDPSLDILHRKGIDEQTPSEIASGPDSNIPSEPRF